MHKLIVGICLFWMAPIYAVDTPVFPPVEMALNQLSPHVYYVQGKPGAATENEGFISNAVGVLTAEGWVVVDALGSPPLAEMFLQRLRKVSDKPVKKVFITHYHADHIYGLQVFKAMGAEVYAPAEVDNYLSSEIAENRLVERRESLKPWVNADTHLVRPDHYVKVDLDIKIGDMEFVVMPFGSAHSEGDLSVYVKTERVLIAGDLIFNGRIPFIGGDDIRRWIDKLAVLEKIPSDIVVPGHGAAFKDSAEGSLLTRDYLQLLLTKLSVAVQDMTPFDEAYAAIDWGKFKALPAFDVGNRRNAYRVYTALEAGSFEKK